MITQRDIDDAQTLIDEAQAALLAYVERGGQEPTDIVKHNALVEQVKAAQNNFEQLVAARLKGQ
jgi:protein tyrosine phosphatase (PTP) superfamily phosphohydrolase (DUF442 family)